MLNAELIGPLRVMMKDRDSGKERLFLIDIQGVQQPVWVRLRGKSRLSVCDFPPLRFRFEEGSIQKDLFQGYDKLKLVTHCSDSKAGERNVLEEYLAYRIFALLTDASFRVRLLHMTYSDEDKPLKDSARDHHAFLLEPANSLAARLQGIRVETPAVKLSQMDREQAALVYVFQYMIGNTDWSFVTAEEDEDCCHNGELVEAAGKYLIIPYDFDLAGIVNARYARPDPDLRMRSVVQRRYRGFCTDSATLKTAVLAVKNREADIRKLVNSTPGLDQKERDRVMKYLSGFFDKAEDADELVRHFEQRCLD